MRRVAAVTVPKLGLEFPGACYHLINRGSLGINLFKTEFSGECAQPSPHARKDVVVEKEEVAVVAA